MNNPITKIIYCTAIGDALGLAFEGMSRRRIAKFNKDHSRYHLLFNYGMVSDDTDHTFFVASALAKSSDDVKRFQSCLRWKLMLWLLTLPVGIGKATLLSIIKMWLGFPSSKTGIFSAGNGAAMRVGPIAYYYKDNDDLLEAFVRANTELTHTDPKAQTTALAVAKTIQYLANNDTIETDTLFDILQKLSNCQDWQSIIRSTRESFNNKNSLEAYCDKQNLSKGITGYCYHTVPAAIYAVLINNCDYEKTFIDLIKAGGDTDTTAAIAGAILGAKNPQLKSEYLDKIIFFPHSKKSIESLGDALINRQTHKGLRAWDPLILLRSIFLIMLAFIHIFRRALPPY